MIPTVFIVGADKGGVGKTTVSRVLLDYLTANGIEHRAFDTETPNGSLKRFFNDKTELVDLATSDGQMRVFDTLGSSPVTLIDIRAGLLSPMLKTLGDIGFLDAAKQNKLKIVVLHVIGPASTSLAEVAPTIAALDGSRHIVVANHINDTEFDVPADAINIPKLDERACDAVDKAAQPFSVFINTTDSLVKRGIVNHWVNSVYDAFNAAKLSAA